MEAVGQLASGLAHDFNNLLAAILGNLELMEMRLKDERLLKLLQAAVRSARRGAALNEQMLAFSRKQHLTPRPVAINELVSGIDDLLRRTLGGTVDVAIATAPRAVAGAGRPAPARTGAAQPGDQRARRDAARRPPGDRDPKHHRRGARQVDRSRVRRLCVGIGRRYRHRHVAARSWREACEPFFTTKEPGKGSGLGLAQVYGMARQSGGSLRLKSAVGEGTTVELYLPRSLEAVELSAEAADRSNPAVLGNNTRVLVVDDHEDVREVIVAYLETLGYDVMQASSGHTALDFLRENSKVVDLLIADYAMPEMSGLELLRAVRDHIPTLPVVIVTGYAETGDFDDRRLDAVLLKKPFRMNELAATVETALARDAGERTAKIVPLRPRKRS